MNEPIVTSPLFNSSHLNFDYAFGKPEITAGFRTFPEDFNVDEDLGFEPSGEGEHLVVYIEKENENTHWVAEKLAHYFSIKVKDVGFCGLKDRHAVTTQWFSLYLPKLLDEPDWSEFIRSSELHAKVLSFSRHNKKLRRGEHKGNRFSITLRSVFSNEEEKITLEERINQVKENGVPNYFGEQRFGRDANNLNQVQEWVDAKYKIKNSKKRSIIYSSARSYIFNRVLSQRVLEGNWNTLLEGDIEQVGSATGPLWGRGRSSTQGTSAEFEARVLTPLKEWCDALEHVGLNQERRTFVLRPQSMSHQFEGEDLQLSFSLAPGQYATSVLREISQLNNLARV
ncbi:MAG: tRNA pseudouridine(13) synthase TruD [Agarilytica sp.]